MKQALQNIIITLILVTTFYACIKEVKKEVVFQSDKYYKEKTPDELESLCQSDAKACHKAAVIYLHEKKDEEKADLLFIKGCEDGYPYSCNAMGEGYMYGKNPKT